ncbi:ATP-dependent helicase [Corynebacterium tapiri]
MEAAVERIAGGADPNGLIFITPSKESGSRVRRQLHERLLARGRYVSSAPLVRSVHSLAFALVRQAQETDIRLISGAEQDGVIRTLLAGHAEDGRGLWPDNVREALTYVGFARQLRDLLLRAVERGLGPQDLMDLGRQHGNQLWVAAGDFLGEYEQAMALTGTHNYSASELTTLALETEIERAWHTVLVDDAHHLDPQAGQLINRILPGESSGLTIIGGDRSQSVFHFRGATTAFFDEFEADPGCDVSLGASKRCPEREILVADSATAEGAAVADRIRRHHLEGGIDYSDMAVIVRSTSQLAAMRRALLSAGVPVASDPTDIVLAEHHLVSSLLLGLRALEHTLSPREWETLIVGPIGGADPVTLRRLIRGLRRLDPSMRGMDTLLMLLSSSADLPDLSEVLTEAEQNILVRIRLVLDAGRASLRSGGSLEEVLWEVWNATSRADSLMAAALRGGPTGSQADRDLDAVMALFDSAGDFVERHPGTASITSFVDHIAAQELPTGVRDRRAQRPQAVNLLTAHAAVGREFSAVVVAGVYEGVWPTLGETGSLFGQENLLDLVDRGIDPSVPVSHAAARLQEERRLLHVATSRACDFVTVTSANNLEAAEPIEQSRLIDELAKTWNLPVQLVTTERVDEATYQPGEDSSVSPVRLLSASSLVALLRRTVCDPDAREDERTQAARQLARLAQAGVPGADPEQWWSMTEPTTEEQLFANGRLSPSRIEALMACPLNAVVGRMVEDTEKPLHMIRGTLAHIYLEALGRGVDEEYARLCTMDAYRSVQNDPEWRLKEDAGAFERLLQRTAEWVENSRSTFTLVEPEVDVHVDVTPGVSIAGRIDRLEIDDQANYHIIDLKTGKTPPTKKEASEHVQLRAYQLALSRGVFDGTGVRTAVQDDEPMEVGGANLVYPASANVKVPILPQAPQTAEDNEAFAQLLPGLVESMKGPRLTAVTGPQCDHCPIHSLCPIQPEGQAITHG